MHYLLHDINAPFISKTDCNLTINILDT